MWNQNNIVFYKSIGSRQQNKDFSILIYKTMNETRVGNVYIDYFYSELNTIITLNILQKVLRKKYSIKDF